jgi:hypothetical protein
VRRNFASEQRISGLTGLANGAKRAKRPYSSKIGEDVRDGEACTCMSVVMTVNWRLLGVFTNVHEGLSRERESVNDVNSHRERHDAMETETTSTPMRSTVTHTPMCHSNGSQTFHFVPVYLLAHVSCHVFGRTKVNFVSWLSIHFLMRVE